MSPALLALMTFGAVITAIAGIYSVATDMFLRDRSRVSDRLDEEFHNRKREKVRKSLLFKAVTAPVDDAADGGEGDGGLRHRLMGLLEQSGLDMTFERLMGLTVAVGLGLGLVGGLIRHSVIIGLIGVLVGAGMPTFYVNFKRKARLEKMLSQLPDAFDMMARVVRAGQSLGQGMLAVGTEFRQPIRDEFALCYEHQNLGMAPEDALRDLARRTGLVEIKIFVLALLVQQQTGGNLAELLDKLAEMIRERYRIRGQIKALTAEGRLQAMILLGLPPLMFVLMVVLNREYASDLLAHPSLLVGTFVCVGIGALWINKIVNFDF